MQVASIHFYFSLRYFNTRADVGSLFMFGINVATNLPILLTRAGHMLSEISSFF